MMLSALTRESLRVRRERRRLEAEGWQEVGEGGGRLWQLHRGSLIDHIITDVCIGPTGKTIFIKTAPADES